MSNDATFRYHYSARENKEILAIREKYLPREESKLEELKRLDRSVQEAGVMQSLCVGILGCLVFGLGLCFAMEVIGNSMVFGIILGLMGMVAMLFAYPVHRRFFLRKKEQFTPRILELAAELSGDTN